MIILEGPDGAGKSYTAEWLSSRLHIPTYHFGGPPKSREELLSRIEGGFSNPNRIFDRCPVFSEQIYGPVVRGNSYLTTSEFRDAEWCLIKIVKIIYCRPSYETILKTKLQTKPHKDQNHLNKVKKSLEKIIKAYDQLMVRLYQSGFKVVHFNRDTTTLEDLLCAVLI